MSHLGFFGMAHVFYTPLPFEPCLQNPKLKIRNSKNIYYLRTFFLNYLGYARFLQVPASKQ
jgi:hypothetical protein